MSIQKSTSRARKVLAALAVAGLTSGAAVALTPAPAHARNIRTGATIKVKATAVPAFRAGAFGK